MKPRSCGLHLHRALEEAAQPAPGIVVGERVVDGGHELVEALLEERGDQVVAVAEAPVGGADPDARAARHLVHRRVEPALGEDLLGRREETGAVARRVGAQGTLDGGHAHMVPTKRRQHLHFSLHWPAMASSPTSPTPSGADDKLDRGVLMIASVVVLGAIMSILDVTVVNVAIKTLAEEFDAPLSTIQWVATGYTLALATVIPLTGWAADRFGTKRLYMTSIALFVVGSMLSGLAWSAESLIVFRVLQGFGGGMIMPLGMTILTRAAGPQRVGRVMAIIGVPMLLGPILGPILGGWLVDAVSWRWIFFINLPIGIAALIASRRILARDVPEPSQRLDWLGFGLLSPGLALLIYGLAETSGSGGFARAQVIGPGLVGLAMLAALRASTGCARRTR